MRASLNNKPQSRIMKLTTTILEVSFEQSSSPSGRQMWNLDYISMNWYTKIGYNICFAKIFIKIPRQCNDIRNTYFKTRIRSLTAALRVI